MEDEFNNNMFWVICPSRTTHHITTQVASCAEILLIETVLKCDNIRKQARTQDCLRGGGGVNDGRVQRAPSAYTAFFAIVKKFVEKENWWSRAGGGGPPPPSGSAPGKFMIDRRRSLLIYSGLSLTWPFSQAGQTTKC